MHSKLLAPVRGWEARRELRALRRRADAELISTRLPSPRLAWRVQELLAEGNVLGLSRSLTDAVRAADERHLPGASPLDRGAVRLCRAELLDLAARLCSFDRPAHPQGVLLAERLIVDGAGPLYGSGDASRLRATIATVRRALDGAAD